MVRRKSAPRRRTALEENYRPEKQQEEESQRAERKQEVKKVQSKVRKGYACYTLSSDDDAFQTLDRSYILQEWTGLRSKAGLCGVILAKDDGQLYVESRISKETTRIDLRHVEDDGIKNLLKIVETLAALAAKGFACLRFARDGRLQLLVNSCAIADSDGAEVAGLFPLPSCRKFKYQAMKLVMNAIILRPSPTGNPLLESYEEIYDHVRASTGAWKSSAPQPANLKTKLRPYQRRAVSFCLKSEKGTAVHDIIQPFLWEELESICGRALHWNRLNGMLINGPPKNKNLVLRGGIISEAMGLGKTLELLSLFLLLLPCGLECFIGLEPRINHPSQKRRIGC